MGLTNGSQVYAEGGGCWPIGETEGNGGAEREGVAGPVERPRQPRFRGERGARLGPRFEQRGTRQPHLLQVSIRRLLISFDIFQC